MILTLSHPLLVSPRRLLGVCRLCSYPAELLGDSCFGQTLQFLVRGKTVKHTGLSVENEELLNFQRLPQERNFDGKFNVKF